MSTVYEAINDALLAEQGHGIVKNSEEQCYNKLRSIQEQNHYPTSEHYLDSLREDEGQWMEDNFGDDPKAKHSGLGKRSGWKYRTYMPGKYWNARTIIAKAIDKGIDVTGKGKTQLQNEISGKVSSDSSTETTSTNLDKFKKCVLKLRSYYNSMPAGEAIEAVQFLNQEWFDKVHFSD
jgi:hypothetical protein